MASNDINVSVLYREPKLLKDDLHKTEWQYQIEVSVLYREPKLLKVTFRVPKSIV